MSPAARERRAARETTSARRMLPTMRAPPLSTAAKRPLTPARKRAAIAVAALADVTQVALLPLFVEGALSPWEIAIDLATALAILLIAGFHWRLAIALVTELVPGVDLFPTWTALVASLPAGEPALRATSTDALPPNLPSAPAAVAPTAASSTAAPTSASSAAPPAARTRS
jgi:hypothetical protein